MCLHFEYADALRCGVTGIVIYDDLYIDNAPLRCIEVFNLIIGLPGWTLLPSVKFFRVV